MAEGKKSFVLYADLIHTVEKLPDDKAGQLLKHILDYVNDKNPETDDLIIQLSFEPIKQQLKRDLQKWDGIRGKRSDAGKASAEARKLKKEQTSTNSTSVESVQQTSTNPTVSVNVNVNDSVSVNDIKNKEDCVEFSDKDIQFRDFLCKQFTVTEMKQPRQFMDINQAIIFMNNQPEEINKHFRSQCWNYFPYKEVAEEKKHSSVTTFLFDMDKEEYIDRLMSGGWNKSNWFELGKKFSKSEYYADGEDPEDVLNSFK